MIEAVIRAGLAERWNAMPPSHRRRWIDHVLEGKKPETRARRIGKLLAALREYS